MGACQSDQAALFQMSSAGSVDGVRRLLSRRGTHASKVNAKERRSGATALAFASQSGHAGVVRLLVERGAALELATDTGFTALCLAVKGGHDAATRILVNSGASLETADLAYGCTPLLWGVQNAAPAVVRFLLERGADVEARSRFGYTALVYAAHGPSGGGALDKAKLLLAAGSDATLRDLRGSTAAQHARQRGAKAVAELLERALDDPGGVAAECAAELGMAAVLLPKRSGDGGGSGGGGALSPASTISGSSGESAASSSSSSIAPAAAPALASLPLPAAPGATAAGLFSGGGGLETDADGMIVVGANPLGVAKGAAAAR